MPEGALNCVCDEPVALAVDHDYRYRACVRCRVVLGDAEVCGMCNGPTVQMEGRRLTGACGRCGLAFDLIVPPPVWGL